MSRKSMAQSSCHTPHTSGRAIGRSPTYCCARDLRTVRALLYSARELSRRQHSTTQGRFSPGSKQTRHRIRTRCRDFVALSRLVSLTFQIARTIPLLRPATHPILFWGSRAEEWAGDAVPAMPAVIQAYFEKSREKCSPAPYGTADRPCLWHCSLKADDNKHKERHRPRP